MENALYRTYEVLVEESIHADHPKRVKDKNGKLLKTSKELKYNAEIDGALRDTHMIFQDAVCYNTLCFAGLAGNEVHQFGEHEEPLNPLWKHLTTPGEQGGIKEETEKVIRRLATHYKPLEGVTMAEEFLNRVYSEPLRIADDMTDAEKAERRRLRAQCYRILEMFGAPRKKSGEQECADMSAFANTWAGLTSKPESDTEIPGNLAYDRVCRELKEKLTDQMSEQEAAAVLEETLTRYSQAAEKRNKEDCENKYREVLEELTSAVADAEILRDEEAEKAAKLKKAKEALVKHENRKSDFEGEFFANRREKLADAVDSALSKPLSAEKAADINLTDDEFVAAKKSIAAIAAAAETKAKPRIRLHYKGGNPGLFEKAMFRYWALRADENELVRRAALADFRKFIMDDEPDAEPRLDNAHIAQMPFKAKGANVAFPLFGKNCLGIETVHSSPDWDFDKTAFATAAEDVFKYKIRTDKRAKEVAKLRNIVSAYEGGGVDKEHSPTDSPIRGMKDDPRWLGVDESKKGIVQLLVDMSTGKDIVSYGLREGTIGGWAEVRKALLALHRKAAKAESKILNEAELSKALESAVDVEMEANRQGFGSADFFHALCDPAYFHLWLDGPGNEHNEIKDFIPHFVAYCEWREELIRLLTNEDGTDLERAMGLSSAELEKLGKRPIRYTWPGLLNRHKKPSFRYYDFAGDLNIALELKCLFRRVRPADARTGFPTYTKLEDEKATLTLAARRLKRDKIINKDTGNSMDALWCPPLILAGEAQPTTTDRPRAGKYEDAKKKKWPTGDVEVSFSLIASPLPGDYWNEVAGVPSASEKHPVHLTVSFKIEANALALLLNEGIHFAGGSLKGVDEEDEKRKFFRWPVDIETEKLAATEAEKKAKLAAEKAGKPFVKPSRKVDVKASELWCQSDASFRVKESRYSKAEKIKTVTDFQILSIDLGNRFAAAFARMRIHADANGGGRVISAGTFKPDIKADVVREGTMRLQGEAADVWQVVTEKNKKHIARKLKARGEDREPVVGAYELVEEAYGNGGRGRFPTDEEYGAFSRLAARLIAVEACSLSGKEKETVPELGDHLVFRLKRRIGRLRTLLNLVWRLCGDKEKDRKGHYTIARKPEQRAVHMRMVIETLARSAFPKRERQPGETEEPDDQSLRLKLAEQNQWDEWRPLFESKKGKEENERRLALEKAALSYNPAKWIELAGAVKKQIEAYCAGADSMDRLLVEVIEFCLPLRGRHWGWDRCGSARLRWERKEEAHKPNIMGMRGLSMKRLEQILNLRQRCQSFAKLEDRYHGAFKSENYNPPDSIARDLIEDVCPLLLERSNRIREQRVDQTAHLILAEALGMELKNPADVVDKKGRKTEVDLHGEYQRRKDKHGNPFPRCSVIVLENLERYKTSQERTKMENSRLMKWAHRAIIEKLEDMCRPFGITLMLVDPAFSSHFDSRTGLPGVRVEEVPRDFELRYPFAKWAKDTKKTGGPTKLAEDIKKLAADFAATKYNGTLVLAVEGGKEFVPVMELKGEKAVINADITAAVNIGLRGVADPQRWDVFPRLRTKKQPQSEDVLVTSWRGWFARFGKESGERLMKKPVDDGHAAAMSGDAVAEKPAGKKKKGTSAKIAAVAGADAADDAGSQSAQSSEYPPFFVQHPEHDWPTKGDWLKKDVYEFSEQDGKSLRAYPQGVYLKRVEQVCAERIADINRARIQKAEREIDNIP